MKKRICLLLQVLCLLIHGAAPSIAENEYPWAVSYATYSVTYDAILKMYLKVINGYKTRNLGRHDLFNEFIFWDTQEDANYKNTISQVKRNVGFYYCAVCNTIPHSSNKVLITYV